MEDKVQVLINVEMIIKWKDTLGCRMSHCGIVFAFDSFPHIL